MTSLKTFYGFCPSSMTFFTPPAVIAPTTAFFVDFVNPLCTLFASSLKCLIISLCASFFLSMSSYASLFHRSVPPLYCVLRTHTYFIACLWDTFQQPPRFLMVARCCALTLFSECFLRCSSHRFAIVFAIFNPVFFILHCPHPLPIDYAATNQLLLLLLCRPVIKHHSVMYLSARLPHTSCELQ